MKHPSDTYGLETTGDKFIPIIFISKDYSTNIVKDDCSIAGEIEVQYSTHYMYHKYFVSI